MAMSTVELGWPAPGVCRVEFGDPSARNALDSGTLEELARVIGAVAPSCLVLAGRGGCFSAGYDLKAVARAPDPARAAERLVAHPASPAVVALARAPFPTIAQIAGYAIGGGLELAVACDLRIAATTAHLQMPPAALGLVYSHTGVALFLDLIGLARTRELFLTARCVDGGTAEDWGLVNQAVEPCDLEEHTLELATRIATFPAAALAGTKRVLRALERRPLDERAASELERARRESLAGPAFMGAAEMFARRAHRRRT